MRPNRGATRLVEVILSFVTLLVLTGSAAAADRTGAWVDEVVFREAPSTTSGVDAVREGNADLYAYPVGDPSLAMKIVETASYETSYGSTMEFTFNPYGPRYRDGRLNPFSVPEIREAVNWLIDRNYIVDELYGGVAAIPQVSALTVSSADFARLADVLQRLEHYYAYERSKAVAKIQEQMLLLGAEFSNGKWRSPSGEAIIVKMLVRSDDDGRKRLGDYLADLLNEVGFTVERTYKISREAEPVWLRADPGEGLFDIYTGAWIGTATTLRDQARAFDFFYTPRGLNSPLWQAYTPEPELDYVAGRLATRDFATVEERGELMETALVHSLKDSVRVWIANRVGYTALNPDLEVACDLAGGVAASQVWSRTLRFVDDDRMARGGGKATIMVPEILTGPWNPFAGVVSPYDQMIIHGTEDRPTLPDPYTGLHWPQNVEKAEVYIRLGLPVQESLDWVDLRFVDEIVVPGDAWADWDAVNQRFIVADERFGGQVTANCKAVIHYDAKVLERVWHDGSGMSIGDMLLAFIMRFDRAKPESCIYDESAVDAFFGFICEFKALKLVSITPQIVFEVYTDGISLDAELIAAECAEYLWPSYDIGILPWHVMALGYAAEADGELVFSADKANWLSLDQMNFADVPGQGVLAERLRDTYGEQLRAAGQFTVGVPYWVTLNQYITPNEVMERWRNLHHWYEDKGHLWVSNGPFYLEDANDTARIVQLKRFPEFLDAAGKWIAFAQPRIPHVSVYGPYSGLGGRSPSGLWELRGAVNFEVGIQSGDTGEEEAYPTRDIQLVKWVIVDDDHRTVSAGHAEPVQDGVWRIVLYAEEMMYGKPGTWRIEVTVVSNRVVVPGFASTVFEVESRF